MTDYQKPYVKTQRLFLNGEEVTATAEELNSTIMEELEFGPVVEASALDMVQSVTKKGDIIETIIFIDLTGLKSTATLGDIIGNTGASYLCQITDEINGEIFAGYLGCGEVPTGGDDDIDVYSADEGTGAYDALVTSLTETQLMAAGGALTVGPLHRFTALPTDGEYLYLTAGAGDTAGTYTAGKIYLVFHGRA